jgi:hypothetical protein
MWKILLSFILMVFLTFTIFVYKRKTQNNKFVVLNTSDGQTDYSFPDIFVNTATLCASLLDLCVIQLHQNVLVL